MLLYETPPLLKLAIDNGGAELFGAIIKDTATGQILGHVQQTGMMNQLLSQLGGAAINGFTPLGLVSVVQNEHLRQGVAALKEGMVLMQGLQYGTLALSGLGIGVSVAGFALMAAKLRGIESRLDEIAAAIGQITADRRGDDLKQILAEVSADLRNVDSLTSRRDPQRVAEQLQVGLSRSAAKLDVHFRREADLAGVDSIPVEQLDRLWTLAAAIRLCQEAGIQALFAADELKVAEDYADLCLQEHMTLLEILSPDALARLVARQHGQDARAQAQTLCDGIRGGVISLAGQISIASTLQGNGTRGIDYLRQAREADQPIAFLAA
ncbi:hypothetical protein [Falsirhodobacter xinxiangensis]|uniref:hypothetical protein n=1 Tax=Falsirhodobacter xinxiangensis TaxID=2530049 RepID=UPI0010AB490C|nr:hypothetical protein [Rhodobacter xinxiangensis]